jgi:hypothetical protein
MYYSNFQSSLRYGIIFWGGGKDSKSAFKLKKKSFE